MVFSLRPDDRHPDIQNDGMKDDGMRFRAECSLAGKIYGRPFGFDVAFGDPILGEPVVIVADDVLGFAGIAPPMLRVYHLVPFSCPGAWYPRPFGVVVALDDSILGEPEAIAEDVPGFAGDAVSVRARRHNQASIARGFPLGPARWRQSQTPTATRLDAR